MNNYTMKNRHKFYLKAHFVFVCRYRKELLSDEADLFMKRQFQNIAEASDFEIEVMETHLLISYPPNISAASIAGKLKQGSAIRVWKYYSLLLKKHFWKEHTFWSDGYFVCSIGRADPETIRRYIENQG